MSAERNKVMEKWHALDDQQRGWITAAIDDYRNGQLAFSQHINKAARGVVARRVSEAADAALALLRASAEPEAKAHEPSFVPTYRVVCKHGGGSECSNTAEYAMDGARLPVLCWQHAGNLTKVTP